MLSACRIRTEIAKTAVVRWGDSERVVAIVRLFVAVVAQERLEAASMRQVRIAKVAPIPLAHHVCAVSSSLPWGTTIMVLDR